MYFISNQTNSNKPRGKKNLKLQKMEGSPEPAGQQKTTLL